MQIIKKDKLEQVIEIGDLVVESDSNLTCWVGYLEGLDFPYPLVTVQGGIITSSYNSLDKIRGNCTLLAKNKDITLTY